MRGDEKAQTFVLYTNVKLDAYPMQLPVWRCIYANILLIGAARLHNLQIIFLLQQLGSQAPDDVADNRTVRSRRARYTLSVSLGIARTSFMISDSFSPTTAHVRS